MVRNVKERAEVMFPGRLKKCSKINNEDADYYKVYYTLERKDNRKEKGTRAIRHSRIGEI
jgi:hypothetical protein